MPGSMSLSPSAAAPSPNASPRIVSYAELGKLGFRLRRAPTVLFSLDPSGEGDDRTGLSIIERHELELGEPDEPKFAVEHAFMIRHVERLPRDMEFPDVMALLLAYHKGMLKRPKAVQRHWFAIEVNGVGWPFYSQLHNLCGPGFVIPVVTTGSADDRPYGEEDNRPRMPRMAGLDLFRVMLQLQRIMIVPGAKGADELVREMRSFVFNGRRPEAAEGEHDDLIFSSVLGVWVGARIIPPTARAKPTRERLH